MSRSKKTGRSRRAVTVALRRGATGFQSDRRRRVEPRVAPPRYAERRHAKPGSGIKRARAVMQPRAKKRSPK